MKKVEVVAAIIYVEDEILCVQRPKNKLEYISEKFEFPGGKIEEGESREEALERETNEELSLNIKVGRDNFFLTNIHEYPDFELTMHSFICKIENKKLTLHEHINQEWLAIEKLDKLDWAAADIPIVNKLVANG